MITRIDKVSLIFDVSDFFSGRLRNNRNNIKDRSLSIKSFGDAHKFFDLGSENRLQFLQSLGRKDKEKLHIIAKLISKIMKKGIVGYEYLDVKNRPYKSFVTTRIVDQKLHNAKLFRKSLRNRNIFI